MIEQKCRRIMVRLRRQHLVDIAETPQ